MVAMLHALKRTQIHRRGDIRIDAQNAAVTDTSHHDFRQSTICAIVAVTQLATRSRRRGIVGLVTTVINKRKARDSNPHLPRGRAALAVRPGKPYPATFRKSARGG